MLRTTIAITMALAAAQALAQTANSGPNDPSLARLPGTPPNVSRTAPSEGPARGRVARSKVPPPRIVTETEREFQKDQRRIERDMTICRGC